jgi:signal peptidase II
MLYLLIIFLVAVDQLTKYLIVQNVDTNQAISVIKNFFEITNVKNTGGAFSFLSDTSWGIFVLASISGVIAVILVSVIFRLRNTEFRLIRLTLSILAAGTIGNLIDRVRFGSVIDFLMFSFGDYTFPVFNVADICIVTSSIVLVLMLIFDKKILDALSKDNLPKKDIVDKTTENN